ncbi:hypothetical protein EV421DRAFT_1735273 [Armillaria borealis]|uniref:Uncharacterized protein n=1 Tax=Armillaria borealis TaxID=47425 RepID=A0AA39MSD8_9AGAR|nr:hypothetical protein EV421DRAFT_1735273 [Armillaria borealis]
MPDQRHHGHISIRVNDAYSRTFQGYRPLVRLAPKRVKKIGLYLDGLDGGGLKDTPLIVDDMDNCEGEQEEKEIPIEYLCGLCKECMLWAHVLTMRKTSPVCHVALVHLHGALLCTFIIRNPPSHNLFARDVIKEWAEGVGIRPRTSPAIKVDRKRAQKIIRLFFVLATRVNKGRHQRKRSVTGKVGSRSRSSAPSVGGHLTSTMPDNKFGLFMKRANWLVSQSYLASSRFVDMVDWCSVGGADILCSKSDVTPNTEPMLVSLVGVPFSAGWYNKLSGMGDYDERYPKALSKLKWLLHVKPPVATIFMDDWNQAISILGCLQQHVSAGQPMDMLLPKTSGTEIRYWIPQTPSLRDMWYLQAFESRSGNALDSFNASLKSIKILVLVGSLPGAVADMSLSFSAELKAANIFGPAMQDGTL